MLKSTFVWGGTARLAGISKKLSCAKESGGLK